MYDIIGRSFFSFTMGSHISKTATNGTLQGAYAPPIPGVTLPVPLRSQLRKFNVVVPEGKGAGDTMVVEIDGEEVVVTIPLHVFVDGVRRRPRPGDRFPYETGPYRKVIASTLPHLPGAAIVESKPMIYSNVTYSFHKRGLDFVDSMPTVLGNLLQESQEQLLKKTVDVGGNCCLGINTNMTIDSSGEHGGRKVVIITQTGTPCVAMRSSDAPVIEAEAVIVPDYA